MHNPTPNSVVGYWKTLSGINTSLSLNPPSLILIQIKNRRSYLDLHLYLLDGLGARWHLVQFLWQQACHFLQHAFDWCPFCVSVLSDTAFMQTAFCCFIGSIWLVLICTFAAFVGWEQGLCTLTHGAAYCRRSLQYPLMYLMLRIAFCGTGKLGSFRML